MRASRLCPIAWRAVDQGPLRTAASTSTTARQKLKKMRLPWGKRPRQPSVEAGDLGCCAGRKAQLGVYDANGLLRRFSDNGTNSYAKLVRQNKLSFSPLAVVRQGELRMKTE